LAIHPGSGSDKKNWPEEQWEELLQRIAAETNWRVLLVGGEAEEARLQRLSSLIPVERLNVHCTNHSLNWPPGWRLAISLSAMIPELRISRLRLE